MPRVDQDLDAGVKPRPIRRLFVLIRNSLLPDLHQSRQYWVILVTSTALFTTLLGQNQVNHSLDTISLVTLLIFSNSLWTTASSLAYNSFSPPMCLKHESLDSTSYLNHWQIYIYIYIYIYTTLFTTSDSRIKQKHKNYNKCICNLPWAIKNVPLCMSMFSILTLGFLGLFLYFLY